MNETSVSEDDFFQIENFYEIVFNKKLMNAKLIKVNDATMDKLAGELVASFRHLTNAYVANNSWPKLFNLIDQIELELFKKSTPTMRSLLKQDEIYRFLGDLFFRLDYNLNALDFYRKSVEISSHTNLLALESYENLLNLSIERWHYRMLNDQVRNSAYSRAIKKKLASYKATRSSVKVLDVGSGTGLLSALCIANKIELDLDSNLFKLFACEQSELFYKIGQKFLGSFSLSRCLKLFHKHSNDLRRNEEIPPVDLLVTEIFDDGLLGEGCLNTLYSLLYEKALLSNSAKLIPQSARIYLAAIECDLLRNSNHFG